MFREHERQAASGYIALAALIAALAVVVWWFVVAVQAEDPRLPVLSNENHLIRICGHLFAGKGVAHLAFYLQFERLIYFSQIYDQPNVGLAAQDPLCVLF